ncbi:MAG TPA: S8 family serine peptidase [Symbiobacteriaceae bacterium]|jgi:subtilisin family serine protease
MSFVHAAVPVVPGEFIMKFRAGVDADRQAALQADVGVETIRRLPLVDAWLVRVVSATPDQVMAQLQNHPLVTYVEPNYIWHPVLIPNDPLFPMQWGLRNTGQTVGGSPGTPGVDIGATAAWDLSLGDPNLLVAVTDTGIDINHPDLVANIFTNPGEIAGNGIDDDQNGFIDDVHGWNFFDNNNVVFTDPNTDLHGTHVAGTIAAIINNAMGVAGVAPRVRILPAKFLGPNGGSTADAISAINYARLMGAKVINASWGGGGFSQALQDAIANSGALFVAAAGNNGTNNDTQPFYPASYNLPNLIAVAAINNTGALAGFSNFGPNSVHLAGPGVNIDSTIPTAFNPPYGFLSGTSMATPHVAGTGGLLLSRQPATQPSVLKTLLQQTVKPLASLAGKVASGGLVSAGTAVVNPAYGVAWGSHNTPDRMNPGQLVTVSITVTNTGSMTWPAGGANPVHLSYHWRDDKGNAVIFNGRRTVLPSDVAPGQTVTLSAVVEAPPSSGTFVLQWDMVQELITWFEWQGTAALFVSVLVPPRYAADWITAQTPPKIARGATTTARVVVRNLGSITWPAAGATPVHLSYHWVDSAGRSVLFNGLRTVLPADVAPGQAVTLTATLQAPPVTGTMTLQWDLVQESITWFVWVGVVPLAQTVTIT